MASTEQRLALLAVPCSWCGAREGQACHVRQTGRTLNLEDPEDSDDRKRHRRGRPRPITTLDGAAHGARWQTAFGTDAPVNREAVAERTTRVLEPAVPMARPW